MNESEEKKQAGDAAKKPAGEKPEKESDRVLVWPDLVYRELLAMIVVTLLLLIVSWLFNAPLEEIANPTKTPNPAKAPWYFVGLQEMLVYFDPWIAGVVIPSLCIVGLMVIPYLDFNKKGVGAYNLRDRKFAATIFLFGFFLWYFLILIGQYCRGPGWGWYWPWQSWETEHSAIQEQLRNLSNFWGAILLVVYFGGGMLLPLLLTKRGKAHYKALGPVKYAITYTLLLMMIGFVLKIGLRLFFGIKYLISYPQWYFNI